MTFKNIREMAGKLAVTNYPQSKKPDLILAFHRAKGYESCFQAIRDRGEFKCL